MTRMTSPWLSLAAVVLLQAYTIGLIVYSFTLWVAPLMETFGTARAPVMAAASLAGIVMAIMSPVAGHAADHMRPRTVMLGGLILFAAGLLLASLIREVWQLWLIYGTLGPIGAGLAGPVTCQTFVARSFTRRRGLALGISSAGTALGGLIFPPLIALLIGDIGWRAAHVAIALTGFVVVAPLVWLTVRDPAPQADAARSGSDVSYGAIAGNPLLWIIVGAFIPLGTVFSSLQFNLAPLAADRDLGLQAAGIATSGMAASMICGKIISGTLADRFDHRLIYWVLALAMAGAVAFMTLTHSIAGLAAAVVLLGLSGGGFYPLVSAIVAKGFPPTHFGRAIGLCFLFLNAVLLGPFIAAAVRDATGSYAIALQSMALFLLPSSIVIYFLVPRDGGRPTTVVSRAITTPNEN